MIQGMENVDATSQSSPLFPFIDGYTSTDPSGPKSLAPGKKKKKKDLENTIKKRNCI
jgi:hypothetical protein